jgi:uncharacterized OB-fold protein
MLNQTQPIGPSLGGRLIEVDEGGRPHLVGAECTGCHVRTFPPAALCPACRSDTLEPVRLGREGTLYAYSVVHVALAGHPTPYGVGYVDLPKGVRVFGQVDLETRGLRLDGPVRLESRQTVGRREDSSLENTYWVPLA